MHTPTAVSELLSASAKKPSATPSSKPSSPASLPATKCDASVRRELVPGMSRERLPLVDACLKRYGDAAHFLTVFNPDQQGLCTVDERRTYCGTAPVLSVVRAAYGRGTAKSWLCIQFNDLGEFAGVRDKMTTTQLNQLADVILNQWYYLKVTEIMLFLQQFKAGRYGRFYGAVDAMAITEALGKFCAERTTIIARLDSEERESARQREQQERAASGDCISREEWEELKWMWNMGYEPDRIRYELAAELAAQP